MPLFLVSKSQDAHEHFEVHDAVCECAPEHRHILGNFFSAARALEDARRLYPRCVPCPDCCDFSIAAGAPLPIGRSRSI